MSNLIATIPSVPLRKMTKRGKGGKRPGSGRKKGTPNKSTVAKHLVGLYQSEAIAALRGVCADPNADAVAKVQASCRLLELLPSQLKESDEAEEAAALQPDGKHLRIERNQQVGLKITQEKADQFYRLKMLTRWSYTDILETALDAFEDAWKKGRISGKAFDPPKDALTGVNT